jgi:hypothetical protein
MAPSIEQIEAGEQVPTHSDLDETVVGGKIGRDNPS